MEAKEIIIVIEDYFNLDEGTCYIRSHKRPIVQARHTAIYFLDMSGYSKKQIGEILGIGEDTFYKSIKTVNNDIDTNRLYREQIGEIKKIIFGDNMEYLVNQEAKQLITHVWLKRPDGMIVQPLESIEE